MFTLIFIGFIDRYTSYKCHLPTRTLVLAVCSLWTIARSTMAKQSAIWLKMITVSVHNDTVSLSDVFIACVRIGSSDELQCKLKKVEVCMLA